jgi:hypothetical protein
MPVEEETHNLPERLAHSGERSDGQDCVDAVSWLWDEED